MHSPVVTAYSTTEAQSGVVNLKREQLFKFNLYCKMIYYIKAINQLFENDDYRYFTSVYKFTAKYQFRGTKIKSKYAFIKEPPGSEMCEQFRKAKIRRRYIFSWRIVKTSPMISNQISDEER